MPWTALLFRQSPKLALTIFLSVIIALIDLRILLDWSTGLAQALRLPSPWSPRCTLSAPTWRRNDFPVPRQIPRARRLVRSTGPQSSLPLGDPVCAMRRPTRIGFYDPGRAIYLVDTTIYTTYYIRSYHTSLAGDCPYGRVIEQGPSIICAILLWLDRFPRGPVRYPSPRLSSGEGKHGLASGP
ncbi:hypothetical protein C8Q69DRAFT_273009 [Paecilomyces variotii]|uniref:Uncharacterized protein n=1 Tax=Byssochlamys spectabilis TaxID=264951 RepID=A0A443HST6_BYSSP|nr:hypothetical protein C8Q69DRAFT_273009 [Paecilomyces variotii]RWQ94875.1 hypothetical protein C8Q69DRAFT_273009 [Paecilomyces variotii]